MTQFIFTAGSKLNGMPRFSRSSRSGWQDSYVGHPPEFLKSRVFQQPRLVRLLAPVRICRSLFFHLLFGLIGGCLLIGQILGCVRIRRWKRHIGRRRGRIRSLRQAARALLLRQRLHAVVQLFLEVIVHLLQVFHGNQHLLARAALCPLASRDTRSNVLIGIGSIGEPRDDVSTAKFTFLAIGYHRDVVVHDKSAPRGIECRRHVTVGGRRNQCLSIRGSARSAGRLLLVVGKLRLHFFSDRLLHLGSQHHRTGVRCLPSSVSVV